MRAAEAGDRAEDLVLKEVMAKMDMHKATGGRPFVAPMYERLGLSPIPRGSYFGHEPATTAPDTKRPRASARDEKIGKYCADVLFDKSAFDGRVARLGELDAEGAYAVAVRHDLFAGLTCALLDEADKDLTRSNWENGFCVSYIQMITTTVWRGERHRTDGGFGAIDADRLVAYLTSDKGNWRALLDAAISVAHMAVTADFGRDERTQAIAHRAGRDSWTFFQLALVHRNVARCIFFGAASSDADADDGIKTTPPLSSAESVSARCDALLDRAASLQLLSESQVDQKTDAIARGELTEAALCAVLGPLVARANMAAAASTATALAQSLQSGMRMMWNAPSGKDPGSVIEANMSQVAAMLSYWCKELNVAGIDFERVLGLDGNKRAMYRQMSVPMGEATIRKGRFLNQMETMALLQPGLGCGPPPGAGGGGGTAKGKKKRR